MRYTKRIAGFLLSAALAVLPVMTAYAKPDWPSDTGIESEAGIVIDADSGAVLFGQNIHMQKAPASITKLLTALVVLEHVPEEKLGDMVTFSYDACFNVESGSGNKLDIVEGDQLSVEDCLYFLLLQSSNQAGNALAEYVAGSREAFVDLMNEKIAEIGCEESHFANPSGLNDEEQFVTAYDMAMIAREAYSNPKLLEIGSALSRKLTPTQNRPNGATITMEHKMLLENDENYYSKAVAGKTGYTSIAGQTLVTLAEDEARRQISVTLKSTAWTHYKDTRTLQEFGFSRFQNLNIAENETWLSQEGPIQIGDTSYEMTELSIDSDAQLTIPNAAAFADAERSLLTELPVGAPEGAVARLDYTYNERKVGSAYVYSSRPASVTNPTMGEESSSEEETTSSEEKSEPLKEGKSAAGFVKIVLGILGAIFLVGVIVAGIVFYHKKQEEKRLRAERRKARRRKVLEEVGCSEEEFNRLLRERMGQDRQLEEDTEDEE